MNEERKPLIEDEKLLSQFGISIPEHSLLPKLFLKLYPSDFIVEEIGQDGSLSTIDYEEIESTSDIEGNFWRATLVKCNMGTHDVVIDIANKLGIREEDLSYAGLKDEFAITSQEIIINGVSYQKLLALKSDFYFLKSIKPAQQHIKKGSLKGNRFTITLRTLKAQEENLEALERAVQRVEKEGFYNFYYLQRFGLPRLNNHYIGSLILHGDYEGALQTFLCEEGIYVAGHAAELRKKAFEIYGKWEEMILIYKEIPNLFQYEIKVLEYLITSPRDHIGALGQIPHINTLWVYALSSWLFNTQLSYAIQQKSVPNKLPLFLTNNKGDLSIYEYLLKKLQAFPPRFNNICKVNSQIELKSRYVDTKVKVSFNTIKKTNNGVVLSFDLGKGSYATTLLAHIAQLVSYVPPEGCNKEIIDSKSVLGTGSLNNLQKTLKDVEKPVFLEEPHRI